MSEERDQHEILERVTALRAEHRRLDEEAIEAEQIGFVDQLAVRRIKKRKLAIKDEIARLLDTAHPDIIA